MRRMPFVFAVALSALSATSARADLAFAKPTIDAGDVRSGTPLKRPFAFVNAGPDTVEITDLHTSCGCLKPTLAQRVYRPGERGEVVLDVHTLSQPAGEHTWRMRVVYRSGGESHEADLAITGRIVTEVAVQPASMTIFTDRAAAHEIALTDLRDRPLSVTAVHTSSPHLKAEVKQIGNDSAGHRVVTVALSLGADCPEGRHEEAVVLLTDDVDYRELSVPVTVVKNARQRVSASPGAVSLMAPRGQAVPSRIVLLRPAGDGAVEVDRVETDDPAIVCTWAAGPDNCATLRVTMDRNRLPAEGLRSAIHVHISKPASEIISVPVTYRVE
jgi:Protein of unknown function (DUF1573)